MFLVRIDSKLISRFKLDQILNAVSGFLVLLYICGHIYKESFQK